MLRRKIDTIHAREILDSRGNPTLEVEMSSGKYSARASVPSGASTGTHEALELRDGGKRYQGKGVRKAARNVMKFRAQLLGFALGKPQDFDALLCSLDGTSTKKNLGANTTLALSLCYARLSALARGEALFLFLHRAYQIERSLALPQCYFNVINGGKHADNELSIQEFMIVPRARSVSKQLEMASDVYHELKTLLIKKYGRGSTGVGDEGGFAPERLDSARKTLDLLMLAIKKAGYEGKVDLALDVAASEFYSRGNYLFEGKRLTLDELHNLYLRLFKRYPLVSLEDPFNQEAFSDFAQLRLATKCQLVGDDLTVTNVKRLERAIREKSISCLLLKVNQVGTLSEAIAACQLAYSSGLNVMVSHRSGETCDDFIADLVVALGSGQLKAGAPCRGERLAKYNRLLRISELL